MEPKWLTIARGELGVTEASGKASNERILEYFEAAGSDVKNDATAWCSAYACWVMEQAGYPSTNNLAARSWLKYGKQTTPKPGAILVFSRGNNAWQGHVGFYVGETATHYRVLGGNQGNKVSIATYPKARLLSARWPNTVRNSNTMAAGMVGTGGTALGFIGDAVQEAMPLAQEASDYIDYAKYACFALGIAMFIVIMWRRYQKMKAPK
jgi:uncharacterized protein (TIGR02594 family)